MFSSMGTIYPCSPQKQNVFVGGQREQVTSLVLDGHATNQSAGHPRALTTQPTAVAFRSHEAISRTNIQPCLMVITRHPTINSYISRVTKPNSYPMQWHPRKIWCARWCYPPSLKRWEWRWQLRICSKCSPCIDWRTGSRCFLAKMGA